jgi:hypothetical protein
MLEILVFYCGSFMGLLAIAAFAASSLATYKEAAVLKRSPSLSPKTISVVILIYRLDDNLLSCLMYLFAQKTRNLEVYILSPFGPDKLKKFIQSCISRRQLQQIKINRSNNRIFKQETLYRWTLKHIKSDFIIFIDSSMQLKLKGIKSAATLLNRPNYADILSIDCQIENNLTLISLFQQIDQIMTGFRLKSLGASVQPPLLCMGSTLQNLTKPQLKSPPKIKYTSVISASLPPENFKNYLIKIYQSRTNKLDSIITAKVHPFAWLYLTLKTVAVGGIFYLFGYFTFLAISLKEPSFLLVSWLALMLVYTFAISLLSNLSMPKKLGLVLIGPGYFIWFTFKLTLEVTFTVYWILAKVIKLLVRFRDFFSPSALEVKVIPD